MKAATTGCSPQPESLAGAAHHLPAEMDLQQRDAPEVSATTNKIESYHAFTKWLNFGGDVITENDPNEQQKRLRYIDLVASAVILQNTVDMMRVLQGLHDANEHGDPADVEYLSPYMTTSIKRFGSYHLDLKRAREPWLKEAWFQGSAKGKRQRRAGLRRSAGVMRQLRHDLSV